MTKDEYTKWITQQYVELLNLVANDLLKKDAITIPNRQQDKVYTVPCGDKTKDFGEPYCGQQR